MQVEQGPTKPFFRKLGYRRVEVRLTAMIYSKIPLA